MLALLSLAGVLLSGCGGGGGGGSSAPLQATTIHGALQAGDQRFGTSGSYVVFYSCHARQSGDALITMDGATYPPLLELGTKQADGSIQEFINYEGGADNSDNPVPAKAAFSVVGGVTYYVAATTLTDTSAGPLPTGSYTLMFSSIFDNVQQENGIQANVRTKSPAALPAPLALPAKANVWAAQ